ncbi:MAG: TatD family hydrolase [Trichloromonadaceae bacterium]
MNLESELYFDTHAHLDLPPLSQNLDAELRLARQQGVQGWLLPGVRRCGWTGLLACAGRHPGLWAAPGLHPMAVADWSPAACAELESMLSDEKVLAVGEIGLDACPGLPAAEVQEAALRGQIRLALAARRPLLIHCRRAFGRLLEILRQENAARVGGIFHGFSGSLEVAQDAIRLNFAIGLGGVLTRPGARRLPQLAAALPAEWLVLETDASDLSPDPVRGQVNRPAYLPYVAKALANLRGWDLQETGRLTTANARRVLGLSAAALFPKDS